MDKKKEIIFQELGKEERKLLLLALDIDDNNIKCYFCKNKTNHIDCAIMPSLDRNKLATILCNSAICMSKYLDDRQKK